MCAPSSESCLVAQVHARPLGLRGSEVSLLPAKSRAETDLGRFWGVPGLKGCSGGAQGCPEGAGGVLKLPTADASLPTWLLAFKPSAWPPLAWCRCPPSTLVVSCLSLTTLLLVLLFELAGHGISLRENTELQPFQPYWRMTKPVPTARATSLSAERQRAPRVPRAVCDCVSDALRWAVRIPPQCRTGSTVDPYSQCAGIVAGVVC